MKVIAGLLAALAILGAGAALWFAEPWAGDGSEGADGDLVPLSGDYSGSACRQMAGLAAKLAEREQDTQDFLRAFGLRAAGIRRPPRGYGDLARGGRNLIAGRGFLDRFDDGTAGQVRHFAGIAAASTLGGGGATRFISIFVRDDPLASPDGRLTEEGIIFANQVLEGELAPAQTPEWLLEHLCRRK